MNKLYSLVLSASIGLVSLLNNGCEMIVRQNGKIDFYPFYHDIQPIMAFDEDGTYVFDTKEEQWKKSRTAFDEEWEYAKRNGHWNLETIKNSITYPTCAVNSLDEYLRNGRIGKIVFGCEFGKLHAWYKK